MFNDDQDEKKRKTILQYDAQGFIISPKQARDQLVDEVSNIKKILEESRKELIRALRDRDAHENESALARDLRLAQIKPIIIDSLESYIQALVPPEEQHKIKLPERKPGIVQNAVVSDSLENPVGGSSSSSGKRAASESQSNSVIDVEPASATAAVHRERDDKGRYTGSKDSSRWDDIAKSIVSAAKNVSVDVKGTDPTVDAISEVATALSPVKRAAGFMLRPLTGLMKSRKRNEPLPKEQTDHNRKQIKILQKIADNNSSGGIFGLLRMLPMALAGIGTAVAAAVTGLAPLLATAIAGAVGKYIGSNIHDKLEESETGRAVNDFIGNGMARTLAFLGNDAAKEAVEMNDRLVDAERYKNRKENPAWYSNDGVYRFARKLGVEKFMKEETELEKATREYKQKKKELDEKINNKYGSPEYKAKAKKELAEASNEYLKVYNANKPKIGGNGAKKPVFGAAARQMAVEFNSRKGVLEYFINKGWTKEQAAGIVANIEHESGFDHKARGDGGKAFGLAQWHPSRQKNFKKVFGKNINDATFQEQLDFIHYEMTKGAEQSAGKKLQSTKTASEAGAVVSKYYERPLLVEEEASKRAITADKILKETPIAQDTPKNSKDLANFAQNATVPTTNTMMQKTKSHSMLSTTPALKPTITYQSPGLSYKPPKLETKVEPAKEYLTSPDPQKVHVVNSSGGNISQNVSNRILAHAITGGLGQDRWNG